MIEPEGGPVREFDELFVRIRPELESYARALLLRWQVTNTTGRDVVQTTYVKLRSSPEWLLRVVAEENRVRYIRSAVFSAVVDATPGRGFALVQMCEEALILDIAAPQSTTGQVTRADQRRTFDALRDFLPKEDQALLRRVVDEGRSFEEVAELLGVTARSVRRRYQRITETLARMRRAQADGPEEDRHEAG